MTESVDFAAHLVVWVLVAAAAVMPAWLIGGAFLLRHDAPGASPSGMQTGNATCDALLAISRDLSRAAFDDTPLKPETIALDPMTATVEELDAAQADCNWVCAVEYPETKQGYERGCSIREAIDAARKARGLPAFDSTEMDARLERRWQRRRDDEERAVRQSRAIARSAGWL